tara:strand:+ start:1449 stop:2132 length:684 start_codon:yes stop_codon:yes gene_type:complete
MKNIAIIPARGGSKRFPRKNVIDFHGQPIISYSILAAIKSKCFDKVVVTTEDKEIKKISLNYGATVYDRPIELSGDNIKVADVLIDCINHYESLGEYFDIVCCLFPTSPLRDYKDIQSVMKIIVESKCDYSMAITKMPFPAWQALQEKKNNILQPFWPKLINKNSQQIGELYVDNGSTYAIKINALKKNRSLNGEKISGHKMDYRSSVDIDYYEDYELAKLFFKKKS